MRPPCDIEGCDRPHKARGYCMPHYRRLLRHGDPLGGSPARVRGSLRERFWPKVAKGEPDECWLWTGASNNKGYGWLSQRVDGAQRMVLTHRLSWELANGQPVPEGLLIMHSCDNPPCVNPAHLSTGTASDNMQDMWDKGRR